MNEVEKRDLFHSHLHMVEDPVIDEINNKMLTLLNDASIEESEKDILKGNVVDHEDIKQEVLNLRPTK